MKNSLRCLLGLSTLALGFASAACGAAEDSEVDTGDEQNLTSGPAFKFDEYSILFTNPVCKAYPYGPDQKVVSNKGAKLTQKPENVFCTGADRAASADRPTAPQKKLLSWINDPATKEIFFAYLSFSNSTVKEALCKAVQDRGVKVTFVLDSQTDMTLANELKTCTPKAGGVPVRFEPRGHEGGIGFAHNKVFMINPNGDRPKVVFSSGNLSSGVVLHHENWHFIQAAASTHFIQSHKCLMNGMLDHGKSKADYKKFIGDCRAAIPVGEEADMKTYFVPGDGGRASKAIGTGVQSATKIDMGAHRFSYTFLLNALDTRMRTFSNKPSVRLVVDDDIWWAGKGLEVGDNSRSEWYNVRDLQRVGVNAKYMQTNHDSHYLHHNKFIIFTMPKGQTDGVFAGAGNLTGTAFNDNFENFYYINVPHVVSAFKTQYEHLFNDLATAEGDLPSENILPAGIGH